ncbi:hypothetical protein F4860DRAFT_461204, partial [Xylaria cubensis]
MAHPSPNKNLVHLYAKNLKRKQTIKFPFYRALKSPSAHIYLIFYDNFITSDSKLPPEHPGWDAKVNCTLKTDLDNRISEPIRTTKRRRRQELRRYPVQSGFIYGCCKYKIFAGKNIGSMDASYL